MMESVHVLEEILDGVDALLSLVKDGVVASLHLVEDGVVPLLNLIKNGVVVLLSLGKDGVVALFKPVEDGVDVLEIGLEIWRITRARGQAGGSEVMEEEVPCRHEEKVRGDQLGPF